jgi:hypothetical protein
MNKRHATRRVRARSRHRRGDRQPIQPTAHRRYQRIADAHLTQYRDADPQTLTGLYTQTQGQIQAMADANALLVTAGLAVIGTLLVLMLKKPPRSPAPPTTAPSSSPASNETVTRTARPEPR